MKKYRGFSILLIFLLAFFAAIAAAPTFAQTKGSVKRLNKKVPVPKNWDYIYDKKKGYGFHVPASSVAESQRIDGIDVMIINTGAPTDIDIFVLAFKDKTLTKEDLLGAAVVFLEELGQTVSPGTLKAESEEYAIADATTVLENGTKGRLRILVGTDITDNYIMIIGAEPKSFTANEKTIDMIWGSFEMWSGGGVSK